MVVKSVRSLAGGVSIDWLVKSEKNAIKMKETGEQDVRIGQGNRPNDNFLSEAVTGWTAISYIQIGKQNKMCRAC